jgi:hypothetical protein
MHTLWDRTRGPRLVLRMPPSRPPRRELFRLPFYELSARVASGGSKMCRIHTLLAAIRSSKVMSILLDGQLATPRRVVRECGSARSGQFCSGQKKPLQLNWSREVYLERDGSLRWKNSETEERSCRGVGPWNITLIRLKLPGTMKVRSGLRSCPRDCSEVRGWRMGLGAVADGDGRSCDGPGRLLV